MNTLDVSMQDDMKQIEQVQELGAKLNKVEIMLLQPGLQPGLVENAFYFLMGDTRDLFFAPFFCCKKFLLTNRIFLSFGKYIFFFDGNNA